MAKSVSQLRKAIDSAITTAAHPMTRPLAHAVTIGRDRLARVDYTSDRCGRAWTLTKIRQAARAIDKALAENNGGGR